MMRHLIPPLRSLAKALGALVFALAHAWVAASEPQAGTPSGLVDIRDVEAAGLLVAMADAANINLVAPMPTLSRRITLATSFASVDELFDQLASALDMKIMVFGRVVAMGARCDSRAVPTNGPALPGVFSSRFQDLPLAELVARLGLKASDDTDLAMRDRRVVLRLNNAPRAEVLQALSAAVGLASTPGVEPGVATRPEKSPGCLGEAPPSSSKLLRSQRPRERSTYCPYRSSDNSRGCEPLEYFSLREIVPRGYVQWHETRIAFVESSDGLLHAVRKGAYIGRNYGKVLAISREAIDLREIIQDSHDVWQEVRSDLAYGVVPTPSPQPPSDYVQAASPQSRYDAAVNAVFLFKAKVVGTAEQCQALRPQATDSIEAALARWYVRHRVTLEDIDRHAEAYARRVAVDLGVGWTVTMGNAHRTATAKVIESFSRMGGTLSATARSYCDTYPSLLEGAELDPGIRFPLELKLLEGCAQAWTCPDVQGQPRSTSQSNH